MPSRELRLCKGVTQRGTSCKLNPIPDSDFCRFHGQQPTTKGFISKHAEAILGFVSGTLSDPIASDIYEYLKEKLGYSHFLPPVPKIDTPLLAFYQNSVLKTYREQYQKKKDAESLAMLVSLVHLNMTIEEVISILGSPDEEEEAPMLPYNDEKMAPTHFVYRDKQLTSQFVISFRCYVAGRAEYWPYLGKVTAYSFKGPFSSLPQIR